MNGSKGIGCGQGTPKFTGKKTLQQISTAYQVQNTPLLRIDYGDDGAIHALVHSNLNSSALDCPN